MSTLLDERGDMDVNLVLFKKNGSRKDFRLPSNVTIIGRRQDCDLCIPLMVVSRRHCEINKSREGLKVRDLGSSNGTYLNGKRVTEAEVKPGDYLQIGPLAFGLQIDGTPEHIAIPDEMILQPPEPLSKPEKGKLSESGTFADQELDSSEGRGTTEIFEGLEDEITEEP
jgi:pSer/pThr/pTyr-binding forkhead associated (FHA) protein